MIAYEFVEREKASNIIVRPCRTAGVSPVATGHGASERPQPAPVPTRTSLSRSARSTGQAGGPIWGTYGVPHVHAELVKAGTRCWRKRVARVMRRAGLQGVHRRRPFQTTQRDPPAEPVPDLVQRTFTPSAPNVLWIADITYLPTRDEGFLYLSVILDVFSRLVIHD